MKFIDFLKLVDFENLHLIVYINEEEDPIWEGRQADVPYWLCDLPLDPSSWGEESVSYRSSLGEEYDNKPGVVICLREE